MESAPPSEPWQFGPEPVYRAHVDHAQALAGATFAPPHSGASVAEWHDERKRILKDWGQRREAEMHRPPLWCMDQLCSGSGFFPPRHLSDDWFSSEELRMIAALEQLFTATGHSAMLARDVMALRIFDVDIRIVADDSYSMQWGMLAESSFNFSGNSWTPARIQKVFGSRAFRPDSANMFADCPFPPLTQRWTMLKDALEKWEEVFKIIGAQRKVYLLNGRADPEDGMHSILSQGPCGGTPMGRSFSRVLSDYRATGQRNNRPLLILALTDGEANDKDDFNNILDEIQDGLHGDVQVCLMGLSLEPEDIAWFEDEECDDTRIRTIEPYEVEQQMILYRKVIQQSADYNFAMHTYRALVTNYFPADYDYEAPIQTLRHRLYITLHALDRRFTGARDATYASGMPMQPMDAMYFCAPATLLAGAVGGTSCCAGAALIGLLGLAATSVTTTPGQRQRKSEGAVLEETLTEVDDELIGTLVHALQQMSSGRQSRYTDYTRSVAYTNSRYQRLPYIDRSLLRLVQRAIGTLSPSETQIRDLQFQDVSYNNRALEVALTSLRQAAQMNT